MVFQKEDIDKNFNFDLPIILNDSLLLFFDSENL